MVGLFGGAFDPPHRGHVELVARAKAEFGIDPLVVLVAVEPGHKEVETPALTRLRLARAAFPNDDVVLDTHARTIETLRAHPEWKEPIFLIGADQFCEFLSWVEPDEVLERTRLAVATRPGFPRERLEQVLAELRRPERVLFFEIEPITVASSDLRERLAAGADISGDVPAAVERIIRMHGLYTAGPVH